MGWIVDVVFLAIAAIITLWIAGAIYFVVSGETRGGAALAAAWLGGVVLVLLAADMVMR